MENIPCSKSYAQRYILAALFTKSKVVLNGIDENYLSADVQSALKLLNMFSVLYKFDDNKLTIDATNADIEKRLSHGFVFNCGESATLIRLLIPIIANYKEFAILAGDGSLMHRRIDSIQPLFKELGIRFLTIDGCQPIGINGENRKIVDELVLDGSDTSQYISGMIMAACFANEKRVFRIIDCPSFDYVGITVDVLNQFGYNVYIEDDKVIFTGERQTQSGTLELTIEKDWSSAAAYIVNQVAQGKDKIIISNLNLASWQCDKEILDLVGCWYYVNTIDNSIKLVRNTTPIKPFRFDCTNCPDLFPVVCAFAATIKEGQSEVIGLDRLVNKESDRGKVMQEELEKYGIDVVRNDNSLLIKGIKKARSARFNSHNDHRISMALIILRRYYGLSVPDRDSCLNKSYPQFINVTK